MQEGLGNYMQTRKISLCLIFSRIYTSAKVLTMEFWLSSVTTQRVAAAVLMGGSIRDRQRWAMIAWHVWRARNKRVFEGVQAQPDEIVREADDMMIDVEKYRDVVAASRTESQLDGPRVKWLNPMGS